MPCCTTVTSVNSGSTKARTARRSRPTLRRCRVWIAASPMAAIPTTTMTSTLSVPLGSWPRHGELPSARDVAVAEDHEPDRPEQVEDHQRDERRAVAEEGGEEHHGGDQGERERRQRVERMRVAAVQR